MSWLLIFHLGPLIRHLQGEDHAESHQEVSRTPVTLATEAKTQRVRLEAALKLQVLKPQAVILG